MFLQQQRGTMSRPSRQSPNRRAPNHGRLVAQRRRQQRFDRLILHERKTQRVERDLSQHRVVIAHEVGHQLGLSHVFELSGDEDNLSDTAGQNEPRAEENLMAPFSGDKGTLTPLQATTLRRNPVVRP